MTAARFKAWACGRSFAGIAGWNLAGGMESVYYNFWVFLYNGFSDGLIPRV